MSASPIELHWVQRAGTSIQTVVRPATLDDALQALVDDPALRPVAGGTDLLLELARSGAADSVSLLDLSTIEGFAELAFDDPASISIGAGVTHADILASPRAHELMLPLAQACLEIGSPQLRNRATIAGNLITASPANDTISALVALDARVRIVGATHREVPLSDFFTGFRTTVLEPTDLVQSILVPHPSLRQRGIWVKAGLRKAQAISVVHAGLVLDFEADGTVSSARIALGSVGPTVELSAPAAQVLIGSSLDGDTINAAAAAAADSVTPIDDGRATADYRSDSVVVVVSRALQALAAEQQAVRWPDRIPLLAPGRMARGSAQVPRPPHGVVEATTEISVDVNGTTLSAAAGVADAGTLLDWLRQTAGTGTKEGCAEGECGACTVMLDGDAVMSCLVAAAQADGATVTTIEGLGTTSDPNEMQQAFVEKFAVQCGYCIPGFVVAAQALADELGSVPTRDEIELALSGNLCRCTGYYNIIDAVITAIAGEQS